MGAEAWTVPETDIFPLTTSPPVTDRSPLMSTWSPKEASSSTKRSPLVVILSVVESPNVKSPLTARLPNTVTSFENVLFPCILWFPVRKTASPLKSLMSVCRLAPVFLICVSKFEPEFVVIVST